MIRQLSSYLKWIHRVHGVYEGDLFPVRTVLDQELVVHGLDMSDVVAQVTLTRVEQSAAEFVVCTDLKNVLILIRVGHNQNGLVLRCA